MLKRWFVNLVIGWVKPMVTVDNLNLALARVMTALLDKLPTEPAEITRWSDIISRICKVLTSIGVAVQDGVVSESEAKSIVGNLTAALKASEVTDDQLQCWLEDASVKLKELL